MSIKNNVSYIRSLKHALTSQKELEAILKAKTKAMG
jgi:hypothetical protein